MQIIIEGREYTLPVIGELTMGQARIIKRYTGLTLSQLDAVDPSDPDLVAAFIHLTLQGDNPDATFAQLEAKVNTVQFAHLEFVAGEGDALPPARTQNGTDDASPTSGPPSNGSSGKNPETSLAPTGVPV